MPSIGPSFFILGLVVASVTTEETTTVGGFSTTFKELNNITLVHASTPMTVTPSTNTNTNITGTTNNNSISMTTSTMNTTNSTVLPSTTKQSGNESSRDDESPQNTPFLPTLKPTDPGNKTTKPKDSQKEKEPSNGPRLESSDSTGIIIIVVIILVALGFGVACYFARKRGRRYSVDFSSRPDEANIPLSTMEPELRVDAVPQNGLQTFENVETAAEEPQEPEAKPEVQEDQKETKPEQQKAEADKSVVDPGAESAAPPPAPDSSEDKPKEEVVEQSPPAPVEPSLDVKTDDEGVDSNKTSVESLKETNENNSNNAACQQRDLKPSSLFWDVPLDSPV